MIVSSIFLAAAAMSISLTAIPTSETRANAMANRAPNTITGFVFDPARRRMADIYVELLDENGMTYARTKTNSSGMYTFRGLPDGVFILRVAAFSFGYTAPEQRISLSSFSRIRGRGSVTEQVDFYLRPNAAARNSVGEAEVVFAQDVPEEARKLYEAGIEDLANKKDTEGLEKLKAAIDLFPTYYLALDRLGTEYLARGHFEAAHVLLRLALHVNPRSFSSRFGFGLVQFKLGQDDDAIATLRLATETYGESANAFMWLGIALHKKGVYGEAKTALVKANKLSDGKSADVHWNLAKVYKDQGLYRDAAEELELMLKVKPDHESADEIRKAIRTLREKADKK